MVAEVEPTSAVILCGGRGLRAWPMTSETPKPLVRVGGKPLIQHVMDLFARRNITRFVLAASYKHELVREFAESLPWQIDVVDTPPRAKSWQRIEPCMQLVSNPFVVTYSDGLANIDIVSLRKAYDTNCGLATITVAPFTSQFGIVRLDDEDRVQSFAEKPRIEQLMTSIGFMMFSVEIFERARRGGLHNLERDVLPAIAAEGRLFAHRHDGFYRGVDTYKDIIEVERMIAEGRRPWLEP